MCVCVLVTVSVLVGLNVCVVDSVSVSGSECVRVCCVVWYL